MAKLTIEIDTSNSHDVRCAFAAIAAIFSRTTNNRVTVESKQEETLDKPITLQQ